MPETMTTTPVTVAVLMAGVVVMTRFAMIACLVVSMFSVLQILGVVVAIAWGMFGRNGGLCRRVCCVVRWRLAFTADRQQEHDINQRRHSCDSKHLHHLTR